MSTNTPATDLRHHDDPIGVATDDALVLPTLLRTRATDMGDAPFLQEVGGRTETYRQTYEASLRWADALRTLGVRADDHVAAVLPPCLEAHHLWIGCGWLGARDAPLNPAYRGHLLQHTLNSCRAKIVVTRSTFLREIAAVAGELSHLEQIVLVDDPPADRPDLGRLTLLRWSELDTTTSVVDDHPAPGSNDLCSLLFTSGTTGPSKGVLIRWGQITVGSELSPVGLFDAAGAAYSPYPVYHLSGKISLVTMARVGGRVALAERYSTGRLWDDIRQYHCTSLGMIGAIAQFVNSTEVPVDLVGQLRYITMSPCLPEVDELSERMGAPVGTAYGSTEAGWPLLNREVDAGNHLSCGRVRDGYELRIVDADDTDLPDGEVGELLVRSRVPQLMSAGYFELPEKSAEAWAGGWFHTGDAFRRDADGRYYFLDRTKDAIRRRGENISSFEVETYLEQHPDVARSAAIAVPSELAEDEVKVCVVLEPGSVLRPAELRAWLEPRMPKFMLPRYIELIDDLPLTDTGKVKKAELRASGINAATWDQQHPG